jgi:hypothetical protein
MEHGNRWSAGPQTRSGPEAWNALWLWRAAVKFMGKGRTISASLRLSIPVAAVLVLDLRAETVVLSPAADTTLFEVEQSNNLGGANFFNAGTARNGNRNRALLQFDMAGAIPSDSIIRDATLILEVIREPSIGPESSLFSLRRVLRPWGEGNKVPETDLSPGLGALATAGEATWLHRFAFDMFWSLPGGAEGMDFSPVFSSSIFVSAMSDPYTFESSPELVADLQLWLDQPGSNFGWLLKSESEDIRATARSFASSEFGDGGPRLIVDFVPVPEPGTMVLGIIGIAGLTAVASRKRRIS